MHQLILYSKYYTTKFTICTASKTFRTLGMSVVDVYIHLRIHVFVYIAIIQACTDHARTYVGKLWSKFLDHNLINIKN